MGGEKRSGFSLRATGPEAGWQAVEAAESPPSPARWLAGRAASPFVSGSTADLIGCSRWWGFWGRFAVPSGVRDKEVKLCVRVQQPR